MIRQSRTDTSSYWLRLAHLPDIINYNLIPQVKGAMHKNKESVQSTQKREQLAPILKRKI